MKNEILLIDPHTPKEAWAESYISFNSFTTFLQSNIAQGRGIKIKYYQYVLDEILAHPELQGNIAIQDIHQYENILELVSTIVFPLMEDENEFFWAFGNAFTPEVFYGSNAFYNLLAATSEWYMGDNFISADETAAMIKQLQYELILQKLYNYKQEQSKEWVHGIVNPVTGLYQYYRINMDRRFTEMSTKSLLPDIDSKAIEKCLACTDGVQQLEDILPMKNMVAAGFTVITLTDVTARQALEQISKEVAEFDTSNRVSAFNRITLLLQTIAGSRQYSFGVMPLLTINNRPALLYENFPFSIIVKCCVEQQVPKKIFNSFIHQYLIKPEAITLSFLPGTTALPETIQNAFSKSGVQYYSLAPVYAGNQLVGIFEISTANTEIGHDNHLRDSLLPVIPYIAQLLQNFIDKFKGIIDTIIKDRFTSIQPAVQWKFNEVAWHYFRDHMVEKKMAPLENISFREVYPMYGAIDIKNSTTERNKALRRDLQVQLNLLREILHVIENTAPTETSKNLMVACDYWLYQLADFINIEQELQLNDFLQNDAGPYLVSLQKNISVELPDMLAAYSRAIDEDKGDAYCERRKLESSIHTINAAVGQYLDLFKVELQTTYPSYFEKLRTDGIEYDIYLGQSIAPGMPFKMEFVYKTRLMQLQSMAAIARLTNSLLPQLQHELHTTQIIFVHSRSIDISFRKDERRFDVEGAYNIRYHIIKKRIDKVHIRNTEERLTQPGKISIVYYNDKSVIEYEAYIRQLQESHFLLNDLEHLELEELQGVSGLKALRVGVNFE